MHDTPIIKNAGLRIPDEDLLTEQISVDGTVACMFSWDGAGTGENTDAAVTLSEA